MILSNSLAKNQKETFWSLSISKSYPICYPHTHKSQRGPSQSAFKSKIQHCASTFSLFTNLPISFTFSPANICVSTPSYGNWHFNYCNYLHCGVQLLDFTDCTLLQARSSPHCLPKLLALSTYNIALVIT